MKNTNELPTTTEQTYGLKFSSQRIKNTNAEIHKIALANGFRRATVATKEQKNLHWMSKYNASIRISHHIGSNTWSFWDLVADNGKGCQTSVQGKTVNQLYKYLQSRIHLNGRDRIVKEVRISPRS